MLPLYCWCAHPKPDLAASPHQVGSAAQRWLGLVGWGPSTLLLGNPLGERQLVFKSFE